MQENLGTANFERRTQGCKTKVMLTLDNDKKCLIFINCHNR